MQINILLSHRPDVEVGVFQVLVLRPVLFLIYINNLSDYLALNPYFFADNTSRFSFVKNTDNPRIDCNNNLRIINKWTFQWKISFNFNPAKLKR